MKIPTGFFSYRHLEGADRAYIDKLRTNLENELFTVTGHHISLWQDVDEIRWGQQWKETIHAGVAEAAFFIPVITPGYLSSPVCRKEFQRFVAFEAKRSRTDLILPLIYVRPLEFDDARAKEDDSIVRLCLERQYADWEPLRHIGDGQPEYRLELTKLGKRIRELLPSLSSDGAPLGSGPPKKKRRPKRPHESTTAAKLSGVNEKSATQPTTKEESDKPAQRTLYVDRLGRAGTYQSIGKALEAAQGGDRIIVAPGHYSEKIELTKPVEIVGEGNLGDVTVEVQGGNVVVSATTFGRLQNLALRQNGSERWFAVYVKAGSLEIVSCEVASAGLSCVGVDGQAEARVRRSRMHGSPECGILFYADARGLVEECELFDNGLDGVAIQGNASATIRGNRIHDNRQSGVRWANGARGLMEDNEISANGNAGVTIQGQADPVVRRNRIFDGKHPGIVIEDGGRGKVTQNEVRGSALSGIEVRGDSAPSIFDNDVLENKTNGFYVHHGAAPTIEANRVERNVLYGLYCDEGGMPQVRRNRFTGNGQFGVCVTRDGAGVFEDNQFDGNEKGDRSLAPEAEARVKWK